MLFQYFAISPVLDMWEKSSSEQNLFAKNIASQIFNYYVDAHFSYCSLGKQHNETFHSPLLTAEKMLVIDTSKHQAFRWLQLLSNAVKENEKCLH